MEWKEVRLGDVCTRVCSGGTPKSTNLSYYGGEIPWLNTKEIDFNRIYSTEKTITDSGLNNSSAKWIVPNTVTVAMYGATAGKSCIVKVPMTTNQACCNLTINDEVADYEFVYYSLKNDYTTLASLANGGAQQNLNAQIIKDYVLKMPSLADQRRIASILSSLDRKIELNNKINADLEEMAQAIFKNWFVDFEPFKDGRFVDSELGMIPEGWKVGSPYEYAKVVYGAPYKSAKFNDNGEGLPLIRIRDLKDCNPQFYTPEILPQTEYVNMGDIVAGMDAEFVPHIWKGNTGLLNQRVCKLMPQQTSISNLFVLYLMKPELEFVQSYKTGTTVSHLGKADIDKFVVVLPPLEVVEECSKILDSILQRIKNISAESRTLSTLRDTLLPRLMSGEIEIPE
mgnify:CR=1 FL=1